MEQYNLCATYKLLEIFDVELFDQNNIRFCTNLKKMRENELQELSNFFETNTYYNSLPETSIIIDGANVGRLNHQKDGLKPQVSFKDIDSIFNLLKFESYNPVIILSEAHLPLYNNDGNKSYYISKWGTNIIWTNATIDDDLVIIHLATQYQIMYLTNDKFSEFDKNMSPDRKSLFELWKNQYQIKLSKWKSIETPVLIFPLPYYTCIQKINDEWLLPISNVEWYITINTKNKIKKLVDKLKILLKSCDEDSKEYFKEAILPLISL